MLHDVPHHVTVGGIEPSRVGAVLRRHVTVCDMHVGVEEILAELHKTSGTGDSRVDDIRDNAYAVLAISVDGGHGFQHFFSDGARMALNNADEVKPDWRVWFHFNEPEKGFE